MTQQNTSWSGPNRRKKPREQDRLFQTVLGINAFGWLLFVAALVVFHYARPELVTGLQSFWGVQGRENWSQQLTFYLVALLSGCVLTSALVLLLKRQRNRRKKDRFGLAGLVLLVVALLSLAGIFWDML